MTREAPLSAESFDWRQAKLRLAAMAQALDVEHSQSPEQMQEILELRARALALPLESLEEDVAAIEVLAFHIQGEPYALETAYIRELTRVVGITQVPGVPAFLRGIANLRGAILPVIDLGTLFERPEQRTPVEQLLVLGREHPEFGIVIDDAEEVISLRSVELNAPSSFLLEVQRRFLRGVTSAGRLVLDGEILLQDACLTVNET